MSGVTELVERAKELGYPALGLTDHGSMGGAVELYTACRKADIKPLPGVELYLTSDAALGEKRSMHLTVASYTPEGYRNLVGLNNLAHRSFHYRPRVDMAQLATLAEDGLLQGLAIGTGCRSGPVVRAMTDRGVEAAEQVVNALAGWFPRVYVEIMDHGFKAEGMTDAEICADLHEIAYRQGLPVIVTSDTHYTLPTDAPAHDALKTLVSWSEDPTEGRFSGSGYWLVDEDHIKSVYEPAVFTEAIENLAELAEKACVTIPELDTFSLKIPDVTFQGTQFKTLCRKARACLEEMLAASGWSEAKCKKYRARLEEELSVVEASGFAGYLLLVMAITDYCWDNRIWFYTRGSATGSLILFATRVTQEDPIEHEIRFDRFLSPDRESPPDVDLDIEHTKRDQVVAHFGERYPVLQVGTTMTYGITTESAEEDGPSGGSLAVKYYAVQRKLGTGINSWAEIPTEDKNMLKNLAERNLVSGRGAHPGGYILAADEAAVAFMPLELIASSKTMVTAFDKDEVEKLGLPKIDLLGSRVLTALHICCDQIVGGDGREYYSTISMKDKETIARCAKGNTVGLFQLGGWTNRKMVEAIKPKTVKDLIAVQALARPAPMASGFTQSYMDRREGKEPVPEMHPHIANETRDTYGLAIYQEQLVGVLRALGLDSMRLTKLLKAVKASGKAHALRAAEVMEAELEPLKDLARTKGWSQADIDWLVTCLVEYGAGYSFGKAHAVQYGCTGYRTAFLATHKPLAYWTGMLIAYTGAKDQKTKEPLELRYKAQARRDGVRVLPPHVHHSGLEYTPDTENNAIREGLTSVSNVGVACAMEIIAKRPFASLVDLAQRVTSKVTCTKPLLEGTPAGECGGHIQKLAEAGALIEIPVGEPMRRAKGRIRRCKECKTTFGTPLEYEDHVEAEHIDPDAHRDE
jgi:DNA polymerase-3 subunit alpha